MVTEWLNIIPRLPVKIPPPVNSPGGEQLEVLERVLPKGLQYLNSSKKESHTIPEDIRENYQRFGRPTPLARAKNLEKLLGTPARIYLKREDISTTGSFKLNTALAQASVARKEGFDGVATETGAGQWGLALSAACAVYGLKCRIFMPRCSYVQKQGRREIMEHFGAEVVPSPSESTASGRSLLGKAGFAEGSIGTAISEALDYALENPSYAYVAGSNFPHVFIHQSIMGLEAASQLKALDERPDTIVACVGGGSNFAGFALPLALDGKGGWSGTPSLLACESNVIPRFTRGEYRYDHSDPSGLTPLVKSYTLGMEFTPPPTHIGGLRQHNGSPILGAMFADGLFRARAFSENEIFSAGRLLAKSEGILPAPESAHAICGVIEEAKRARERGRAEVIVSCISGSGFLDMAGYASGA